MQPNLSKSLSHIGFLTAAECPEHGLLGGYLIVSPQGRPLEFRCTTPVRASRAQEILYGTTLRPYLLSEVLGQPLLAGARLRAPLVLIDTPDCRGLALLVDACIAEVDGGGPAAADGPNADGPAADGPAADGPRDAPCPAAGSLVDVGQVPAFSIGGYQVRPAGLGAREDSLRQTLSELSDHIALDEPFQRIRTALEEVLATSSSEAIGISDARSSAA